MPSENQSLHVDLLVTFEQLFTKYMQKTRELDFTNRKISIPFSEQQIAVANLTIQAYRVL